MTPHAKATPITAVPLPGPWKRRQFRVLGWLAGFWLVSDLGYYFGLPALGIGTDYNANPMPIATFYLFWSGLAAIVFWPLYSRWNLAHSAEQASGSGDLDHDLRADPGLPALVPARAARRHLARRHG